MEGIVGGKLLSSARRHKALWHLFGWAILKGLLVSLWGFHALLISVPEHAIVSLISARHYVSGCMSSPRNIAGGDHWRAWIKALVEGFGIRREAFRQIWHEEGLRVLPRKKRKRLAVATHREVLVGQYPSEAWVLGFQFNST